LKQRKMRVKDVQQKFAVSQAPPTPACAETKLEPGMATKGFIRNAT